MILWCCVDLKVSDDDGNSQSNGDKAEMRSESSEDGNGDEDISDCDDQRISRLFSLSFVNIYGNTEVSRLSDDGRQIKFGGRKLCSLCSLIFLRLNIADKTVSCIRSILHLSLTLSCYFHLWGTGVRGLTRVDISPIPTPSSQNFPVPIPSPSALTPSSLAATPSPPHLHEIHPHPH